MLSLLIVFSGFCSISIHIKLLVQDSKWMFMHVLSTKYLSVSNFLSLHFMVIYMLLLLHLPYVLTRLQFFQEPLDVFVFNTYFIVFFFLFLFFFIRVHQYYACRYWKYSTRSLSLWLTCTSHSSIHSLTCPNLCAQK